MTRLTDWLRASRDERERARQACVERIRAIDPSLHAWVQVDPQPPDAEGPLSGIPFGAKDIIETRGLATEYGSPIYKGRIATEDAAIIRELRGRGAVLMGKTQTTAFAYRTPAPTRNPRNPAHTPGGSSSGSAAAVAAGMVPFALGTQTQGSVLRPAAFCGITGFKPTYNVVSLDGVLPLAPSLDTLGFFTETAADMLALWEALAYYNSQHPTPNAQITSASADVGRVRSSQEAADPPNIALGIPDPLPEVEPPMADALLRTASRLRDAGLSVRPLDLAGMLARLHEASRVVMAYEAARVHHERFEMYGSRLADLADLVVEGRGVPGARYDEARQYIAECRERVARIYRGTPVILVPAAMGPAPAGLAATGDPRMNSPWTALGTPAITIPMGDASGLPLGLQLTADRGDEARLLRATVRIEALLGRT